MRDFGYLVIGVEALYPLAYQPELTPPYLPYVLHCSAFLKTNPISSCPLRTLIYAINNYMSPTGLWTLTIAM